MELREAPAGESFHVETAQAQESSIQRTLQDAVQDFDFYGAVPLGPILVQATAPAIRREGNAVKSQKEPERRASKDVVSAREVGQAGHPFAIRPARSLRTVS